MRSLGATVILAAVLLACAAVPSAAQTATPAFDALPAGAQPGHTVYVTDQAGTTVKGRVVRISPQSIELLVHGKPREWRVSDVGWITERHRHAWRGTAIGLTAGAVFGAVLVLSDCGSGGCYGTDAEMAFVVAGLFGGIGAGAGAAIGAATRSEHILYTAPNRQTDHVVAPMTTPGAIGVRARLRF